MRQKIGAHGQGWCISNRINHQIGLAGDCVLSAIGGFRGHGGDLKSHSSRIVGRGGELNRVEGVKMLLQVIQPSLRILLEFQILTI